MPNTPNEDGWRVVARRILLGLSFVWAGIWMAGGIGTGLDPTTDTTLVPGIILGLVVGALPFVPWWWGMLRRARRTRRMRRARDQREAAARGRAEAARRDRAAMEELPLAIRNEWERMERSRALVQQFADEGWIEPASLLEVDRHTAKLRRLLSADEQTRRLGGETSTALHAQVGELTALLVALADAAVDHQATLMSDDPVPVTLAEARDRLSATSQAYRDLQQPG